MNLDQQLYVWVLRRDLELAFVEALRLAGVNAL